MNGLNWLRIRGCCEYGNERLVPLKRKKISNQLGDYHILKDDSASQSEFSETECTCSVTGLSRGTTGIPPLLTYAK
jgi:hypothetical protein